MSHPSTERCLAVECAGAGDDGYLVLTQNYLNRYEELDAVPCKHAFDIRREWHKPDPNPPYEIQTWRLPWVVQAFNQGGYDCTTVCLDCALEARERMLKGEGNEVSDA